mmetsp:Transcript_61200/g.177463  ORF Transcript_61200/g.177463 Transcript_61200/m.177463 type:complete len:179 (-) Transcript_61200:661-1197(-)
MPNIEDRALSLEADLLLSLEVALLSLEADRVFPGRISDTLCRCPVFLPSSIGPLAPRGSFGAGSLEPRRLGMAGIELELDPRRGTSARLSCEAAEPMPTIPLQRAFFGQSASVDLQRTGRIGVANLEALLLAKGDRDNVSSDTHLLAVWLAVAVWLPSFDARSCRSKRSWLCIMRPSR